MESARQFYKQIVPRALIIASMGIAFGYLIFRFAIFIPTMPPYQITMASVTVALFYSMLKGSTLRNTLAVLLFWFFVSISFVGFYHYWIIVLNFVYIAGISSAVYVYLLAIRKGFVRHLIIRIASFIVITSITNAIIILVLALYSAIKVIVHPNPTLIFQASLDNLEIGTLIGTVLGIGIEIAEFTVVKLSTTSADNSKADAS